MAPRFPHVTAAVRRESAVGPLASPPPTLDADLSPVTRTLIGCLFVDQVRDELDMRAAAGRPAELPELTRSVLVLLLVDRLADCVPVDRTGAVAVDRTRDVFDEFGQARLVVAGHPFARRPAFGLRPHASDASASCDRGRGAASKWASRADYGRAVHSRGEGVGCTSEPRSLLDVRRPYRVLVTPDRALIEPLTEPGGPTHE